MKYGDIHWDFQIISSSKFLPTDIPALTSQLKPHSINSCYLCRPMTRKWMILLSRYDFWME